MQWFNVRLRSDVVEAIRVWIANENVKNPRGKPKTLTRQINVDLAEKYGVDISKKSE